MDRAANFASEKTLKSRAVLGQKIIEFGLVGLIIFSPLPAASVHDWSVFVIQLTVLGLMICCFLTVEKERPDQQRKNAVKGTKYLFVGFWSFVLFQCLPLPKVLVKILSPETYAFFMQYAPDFSTMKFISLSLAPSISVKSALALLSYFLIGFLIVKTIKKYSQIVRMFSVLFIMGVFEAVYGLFDLFSGLNIVSGTFVNRNHFAGYLEMMIPMGLGLILVQEDRGKKAFVSRLMISLGVIVISLALIFSRSRSGVISLVLVFVLFFSFNFSSTRKQKVQKRGIKVLLVSVFVIIIIMSLYIGIDSTLQRFSWDHLLRESRPDIWEHTWDIIADFPLFGSGLGTFAELYPVMEADGELVKTSHAHNDYLEFLSELGVIGMSLLMGGVIFILVSCFLKWRDKENPLVKGLGFGGFVSVLLLLLHGLTDFNLQIPSNILLFSVVLSLTYVTVTHQSSQEQNNEQ